MRVALRRRGIAWPDAVVALAFSVYGMVQTALAPADDLTGPRVLAIVLFGLAPLPLMLGRRRPALAVCSMVAVLLVIQFAVSDITRTSVPLIQLIWAAFIAGAYAEAPRTYLLAALFPVLVTLVDLLSDIPQGAGDYLFPTLILLTGWFVGRLVHGRAAVARRLAEQTARLERERAELAQAAVLGERSRIARELHDVVAHSVSVMVVQAGAARRVLPRSPEESAAALATVQEVGREALDDLRRTLGFLRPAGEPAAFEPAPGLDRLEDLAERARRAGLPVTLHVSGEPWPLPPALGLTAYRIVQEALTNTLKHAGSAHASVRLEWRPEDLLLDVRDTGSGAAPPAPEALPSSGQGLVGMRERAALAGGTLEAGPVRGGGFRVRARLPRPSTEPGEDAALSIPRSEEAQPA